MEKKIPAVSLGFLEKPKNKLSTKSMFFPSFVGGTPVSVFASNGYCHTERETISRSSNSIIGIPLQREPYSRYDAVQEMRLKVDFPRTNLLPCL